MSTRKLLILIVEDDETLRKVFVRSLEGAGYLAVGVRTVEDALAKVAEQIPDLVLTDIRLKGVNRCEEIPIKALHDHVGNNSQPAQLRHMGLSRPALSFNQRCGMGQDVSDCFRQRGNPFAGEHGRKLNPSIEHFELGQCLACDAASPVGSSINRAVMNDHHCAISAHIGIQFD